MDTMVKMPLHFVLDTRLTDKEKVFIAQMYANNQDIEEFMFSPFDYIDSMNTGAVTIRKYLQKAVELGYVSVRKVNHDKYGRVMVKLLG